MPLCVLADRRLSATISSSDAPAAPAAAVGQKAAGSKPLNASGRTARAAATDRISRASAM